MTRHYAVKSVSGTSVVAATEFAGLRVVEVDTTIVCCARKHEESNHVGLRTGLDPSEREHLWSMETLRNTWSGSTLQRVDVQVEHLGLWQ